MFYLFRIFKFREIKCLLILKRCTCIIMLIIIITWKNDVKTTLTIISFIAIISGTIYRPAKCLIVTYLRRPARDKNLHDYMQDTVISFPDSPTSLYKWVREIVIVVALCCFEKKNPKHPQSLAKSQRHDLTFTYTKRPSAPPVCLARFMNLKRQNGLNLQVLCCEPSAFACKK